MHMVCQVVAFYQELQQTKSPGYEFGKVALFDTHKLNDCNG